jgi:hypothetical protein
MDAMDQVRAGRALREVHDDLEHEMDRAPLADGEPWADVIGDDREVFERYERALADAGFQIVRAA